MHLSSIGLAQTDDAHGIAAQGEGENKQAHANQPGGNESCLAIALAAVHFELRGFPLEIIRCAEPDPMLAHVGSQLGGVMFVVHGFDCNNKQIVLKSIACAHYVRYTAAKPRGSVTQKHQSVEVAAPTYKRGFVMLKFPGAVRLHCSPMVTGRGGAYPQGLPHGYGRVFDHHAPPYALKNANGGFLSPVGTKTMTHVTQGRTAPVLATSATHPHQLFADAVNAASMATWYTRRGNIAAAARKARQHLAALNQLAKLEGGAA